MGRISPPAAHEIVYGRGGETPAGTDYAHPAVGLGGDAKRPAQSQRTQITRIRAAPNTAYVGSEAWRAAGLCVKIEVPGKKA